MNIISSKIIPNLKYVYLISFFTLLSGVFYPLITGRHYDAIPIGVIILFIGLIGSIFLYKTTTSETKREVFFVIGLTLIGISLYFIFQVIGKA